MSVAVAPLLRAVYGGVFVVGATCTVYKSPATTTKVILYSDAALTTPITNPQTSDANGEFSFYVASGENLRFYIQTSGGALIRDLDPVYPVPADIKGANIASGTTVDLTTATGDFIDVTGTTTITSFGSSGANRTVTVRFTGALILTHNASSLILPGAASITTTNGDVGVFKQISAGNWACLSYSRIDGNAIIARQGSSLASASTVNIGAATADFFDITGTTTITAFDTVAAGIERTVRFTGALTLTHNATSLKLPGAANITTAADDRAIFRSLGSGNWICIDYIRANGEAIITRQGTSLASASTVNIGAATADFFDITGTTTITAFDTVAAGIERTVRFTGSLTLTHNGTSLILPGAQNITTQNGDIAILRSLGSGNWICIAYTKAGGVPIVMQIVNTETGAVATGTTVTPFDDTIPQNTEGDQYMTLAITPKATTNKLIIDVCVFLSNSIVNGRSIVALFQDSTVNALAAVDTLQASATGENCVFFRHNMTAGTISSTTFKVRAGAGSAATTTFNGSGGGRVFGGIAASSITITEVSA